jgi:hypothetical protein
MPKRQLTPEEKTIAKRLKAIFKASPDRTEEAAGAACGVGQAQVSHWTGGREPIPAKRAAAFAAYMGIDDPGEISVAYRELPRASINPFPSKQVSELRNVVNALAAVMLAYRQHEVADFLDLLGKIPSKSDPDSYVGELIEVLEKNLGAAAHPATRPRGR